MSEPMPILQLETERLILALSQPKQASQAALFMERNRAHFSPWAPPAADDIYTDAYWPAQITAMHGAFQHGHAVRLCLWAKNDPSHLVGTIGFSQIFRGPFCACMLGYQLDQQYEGKGPMREARQQAMRYMFEEQKLHRIGANYRAENMRSGRLLDRLGFTIEGFAKDYLFVDNAWRDHVLTAFINTAFQAEWLTVSGQNKQVISHKATDSNLARYKQSF